MAEPRSALAARTADLAALEAVEVPFLTQIDVRCAPELTPSGSGSPRWRTRSSAT